MAMFTIQYLHTVLTIAAEYSICAHFLYAWDTQMGQDCVVVCMFSTLNSVKSLTPEFP